MSVEQLDLFSQGPASAGHAVAHDTIRQQPLVPTTLDDTALTEAIPDAGIVDAPELAAEAGRRRLTASITAQSDSTSEARRTICQPVRPMTKTITRATTASIHSQPS